MNPFRKFKRPRLLLFFLVLPAAVGYYMAPRSSPKNLRTGKVERETLVQRVTIAGTVEAIRSTIITAPYDGFIKKIFVKLGDHVQTGSPLVSIAQSLAANENVFPIRAPFTGTAVQILKDEGQFTKQGDQKDFILRLDDLSHLYVHANVPEIDMVKIQTGLETLIKASAILDRTYKGIVRDISLAATVKEQWGRTQVEYLVKMEIMDADEKLKPGMTAVIDIITNKKANVLTLGHEYLHKEGENYFVILKDGHRRDVKIGLQNETSFEITDGLNEGQEVQQVDFLELSGN